MGLKIKNPKDIKSDDTSLGQKEREFDNLLKDIKINKISINEKKDKKKSD